MAMQNDIMDRYHPGGRIDAHCGIGLLLVGCIRTECVAASFAPILEGGVFPACTVGIVGYKLVSEHRVVGILRSCAPSPHSHGGQMLAQIVEVTCGCMVHKATCKADGHLMTVSHLRGVYQHIVLSTATHQCNDYAPQICLPMFTHVFFLFLLFFV